VEGISTKREKKKKVNIGFFIKPVTTVGSWHLILLGCPGT
jgi:hypothetical protein